MIVTSGNGIEFTVDDSDYPRPWNTQIKVMGKRKCLGYYEDEISAALAYNKAASEAFGEYAMLNKVEP